MAWHDIGSQYSETATGNLNVREANTASRTLTAAECYCLSVATRRAINAIARNLCQAKVRLFTNTGREVTGGPAISLLRMPSRRKTWKSFAYDASSWFNLSGEYAFHKIGAGVQRLRILNPYRLHIKEPLRPNERDDVTLWRYSERDGSQPDIADNALVFDAMFNPERTETVRGLSPLLTGGTQAGIGVFAALYTQGALQNSSVPSHMLVLPPSVPKLQRDAFAREYLSKFRTPDPAVNNFHRIFVVSGGEEVDIKPIEQNFQDGAFMEAQSWADEKIGQLFGVPPIEMGNLQKTRFDTAAEERHVFIESTVKPELDRLSEAMQLQLIDTDFRFSQYTTEAPRMGKSIEKTFEKARSANPDSTLLLCLDSDTMPIMAEVNAALISSAKDFRETMLLSPKELADYYGIDVPVDPQGVRADIYGENNYVNLTHPEKNAALVPGVKPAGTDASQPTPANRNPPKKELTEDERERLHRLEKSVRKLRKLTLDAIDSGGIWSLNQGDKIMGEEFRPQTRVLRNRVRGILREVEADEAKKRIKSMLNAVNLRKLING